MLVMLKLLTMLNNLRAELSPTMQCALSTCLELFAGNVSFQFHRIGVQSW